MLLAKMNVEDVARKFVTAINRHDVDAIFDMMTDNHRFIDGMGSVVEGPDEMKKGWNGYFSMMPDYFIDIDQVFISGNTVVFLGLASGTYSSDGTLKKDNHWKTPAAWRALVSGSKIWEWQVFADNEPIRKIMRKEGS